MGKLTTHVLDTMHGGPAAGMRVSLYRVESRNGPGPEPIRVVTLNADGRAEAPLLEGEDFVAGRYRLAFEVAAYFVGCGVSLPQPHFLDVVPIDFGVADPGMHYHVPLLVSPWAYSTYRGS